MTVPADRHCLCCERSSGSAATARLGDLSPVLRPSGLYRVNLTNPLAEAVEWNGQAYCMTQPYAERTISRDDGGIEFRHHIGDIFAGLLDLGFAIERVCDDSDDLEPDPTAQPGTWNHQSKYVGGDFVIVARKPKTH